MTEVGYVRIFRSLLGHHAFRNDAEGMAFAWMVIRAQWQPTRVRYKDRVISLDRGQLAISVRDMATALDRDKAWIERLWKRLKSEAMIETASETGVSIVTICNYDDFQGERDTGKTLDKTPGETGARQARDTEQRREKGKNTPSDVSHPQEARTRKRAAHPAPAKPDDVSDQVWSDFLAHRQRLKIDVSETVIAGFRREADRVGWSLERAMTESILRGWRGFKADWIKNDDRGPQNWGSGHSHRQPADTRTPFQRVCDEHIFGPGSGDFGEPAFAP